MSKHLASTIVSLALAASLGTALALGTNDSPTSAADDRVAAIAERFSDSFKRMEILPRELLADSIQVWHIPAIAGDPEVVPRDKFGIDDRTALLKAMPDFRTDAVLIATGVKGFTIKLAIRGTPGSGEAYDSQIILRFIVTNGLVTGMEAAQDPAERARLGEIAREGGYASGAN